MPMCLILMDTRTRANWTRTTETSMVIWKTQVELKGGSRMRRPRCRMQWIRFMLDILTIMATLRRMTGMDTHPLMMATVRHQLAHLHTNRMTIMNTADRTTVVLRVVIATTLITMISMTDTPKTMKSPFSSIIIETTMATLIWVILL